MPTYEYYCDKCGDRFEEFCKISERTQPTKKPCSECGKKEIKQGFFTAPVGGFDAKLKPHPGFVDIINNMKHGGSVPKRFHDKLDQSVDRNGGRYKTQ